MGLTFVDKLVLKNKYFGEKHPPKYYIHNKNKKNFEKMLKMCSGLESVLNQDWCSFNDPGSGSNCYHYSKDYYLFTVFNDKFI